MGANIGKVLGVLALAVVANLVATYLQNNVTSIRTAVQ